MSNLLGHHYYHNTNKWLIITIEIVSRELLGKLILSQQAINKGWNIILASRQSIAKNLPILPRGIFLVKSATRTDQPYIEAAKKYGFIIACLDEEGLVEHSLDVLVNNRLTEYNMKNIDYYFTWGKRQFLAFKERYPNYSDNIFLAGNPRVEIWKGTYNCIFEDQLNQISKKYGRYIFLPTSFAPYNHYIGKKERIDLFARIYKLKKDRIQYEYEYSDYVKNQFIQTMELIDKLAKQFSHIPIVIRVHPSEKKDKWKQLSKKHSNIYIDDFFDLIPLIQQSEIIIQSESTTAIQGFLYSKPVVTYSKTPEEIQKKYRLYLPNLCTENFKSFESLSNFIKDIFQLKNNFKYKDRNSLNQKLGEWIYNINKENISKKIIEKLDKGYQFPKPNKINFIFNRFYNFFLDLLTITRGMPKVWLLIPKNLKVFISLRVIANSGGLKQKLLTIIYRYKASPIWSVFPKRIQKLSEKRYSDLDYGRHKKSGFSKNKIQTVLNKLAKNDNSSKSKVKEIGQNLFILERIDEDRIINK